MYPPHSTGVDSAPTTGNDSTHTAGVDLDTTGVDLAHTTGVDLDTTGVDLAHTTGVDPVYTTGADNGD